MRSQPVVPCGGRVLRNGTPVNRVRAGRQQLSAGTPCAADRLAVAPSAGLRRATRFCAWLPADLQALLEDEKGAGA